MNGYELDAALDRDNQRTRRDRFAVAALTGLLAKYGDDKHMGRDEDSYATAARLSVQFSDALIAELDKPKAKT